MREVTLPSGAVLKITPAPFAAAKALYQALLRELRDVPVNANVDLRGLFKDFFCIGFSSPGVEAALGECFKRCTYSGGGSGDLRLDGDTFEPVERRGDYMTVCMEVAKDNITPFAKSLYAMYEQLLATTESTRA